MVPIANLFWVGVQLNPDDFYTQILSRTLKIFIVMQHISHFSWLFVIWKFYKNTFLFLSNSLIKMSYGTRLRTESCVISLRGLSFNHLNLLSNHYETWFFSHLTYNVFQFVNNFIMRDFNSFLKSICSLSMTILCLTTFVKKAMGWIMFPYWLWVCVDPFSF